MRTDAFPQALCPHSLAFLQGHGLSAGHGSGVEAPYAVCSVQFPRILRLWLRYMPKRPWVTSCLLITRSRWLMPRSCH